MTASIREVARPWRELVLVCRKCTKKLDGGFGKDGRDKLRRVLRAELRAGGRRDVRIVAVNCLGVCPKRAVSVMRASRPGEVLVVPAGTKPGEIVEAIAAKEGPPSPCGRGTLRRPTLNPIAAARGGVADTRAMITRRLLLPAIPLALAAPALFTPARAATENFGAFLAGVRLEARRSGISAPTLDRALAGVRPNQKVLDKIRHAPEFTMTWAHYKAMLITEKRIAEGRAAHRRNARLFRAVADRYGVSERVILGIWGLESSYGTKTGDYSVVESLATLAWDSSRRPFFRSELMAALHILNDGDIAPPNMTGSYAGAMGQPQFMPTSFLRYAVDFQGNGRRDIWTSTPDVLASIANYLARNGWVRGETWGIQVALPPGLDPALAGRDSRRPLVAWRKLGVRRLDGRALAGEREAALILPDGAGGESFLAFANFNAIRRYNPSDFYALVVGLLGDDVLA